MSLVLKRSHFFYLLLILLLGLLLRIYNLRGESIYYDEAMSILQANRPFIGILSATALDNYPPLHNICLKLWVGFFGDSELAVRSLSVLFGCLTVFMTYKVSVILFDMEIGILSAFLVSVSSFHIWLSQEARMYSLMALLALLSIYFFLLLYKKNTLFTCIGYVSFTTLLLYTHYFAFFIVLVENIYVLTVFLLQKHKNNLSIKKWFFLQLTVIVLFLPWVMILANRIAVVKKGFWIAKPDLKTIAVTLVVFSGSRVAFFLMIFLVILSPLKWQKVQGKLNSDDSFRLFEKYRGKLELNNLREHYLLMIWLLVPIVVPVVISNFFQPIYRFKYVIGASLAFYIMAASGLTKLNFNKFIKHVFIVVIVVVSGLNIYRYYTDHRRENWRKTVKTIEELAKPNDLVLLGNFVIEVSFNYYRTRHDLVELYLWNDLVQQHYGPDVYKLITYAQIVESAQLVRNYERVWLVTKSSQEKDSEIIEIEKILSESYLLSCKREVNTIKIYLFERFR